MPYKSRAQQAFFHANSAALKKQGVDISEWDQASKGKKLPKRVKPAMEAPPKRSGNRPYGILHKGK